MQNLKMNKTRKLSDAQVAELRDLYEQGYTQGSLAIHFGVGVAQVGRIVRGEARRIGESGGKVLSPAALDASLALLQSKLEALKDGGGEALAGAPTERRPPPSPLDGGDAPSEVDGAGLAALQETAAGSVEGMDKLLGGEAK